MRVKLWQVLTAMILSISIALIPIGCEGGADAPVSTAPPTVIGNEQDADVTVVTVRVQRDGQTGYVDCVLYNGYRSVAVDCIEATVIFP